MFIIKWSNDFHYVLHTPNMDSGMRKYIISMASKKEIHTHIYICWHVQQQSAREMKENS